MAHTTATKVDLQRLFNTQVHDRQGETFAHIANVWTDENEHPYFLGIQTVDKANHIIPAQSDELSSRGDKVHLAYGKATVQAAPTCDSEQDLCDEDVRRVCDYFQDPGPGLSASSASQTPSEGGRHEEQAIPLKEEALSVGKREVEEGEARLKKVVRSRTEERPVELHHEELVVEREPGSGERVSPESLGEEEYYIPLRHEEAVVQKQAREKARVHVGKRMRTEHASESRPEVKYAAGHQRVRGGERWNR